ncbi:YkvA family protein [Subtercola boreus]|uniref:YkvA family protein n=1 Tax=Subtercola boreus TaxID=120213 RepID=UPI0026CEEAEF
MRIWLDVLLVYLLLPIDLIPDFIPVVGYADDAIIVALLLRFATRHAGAAALDRHWPGTPQGLQALRSITGLA